MHITKWDIKIDIPRGRDAFLEPKLIQKRQKDVSGIEDKALARYARGMFQRDISKTIEVKSDMK